MTKKVSWLITDNNVTVNYDGETHTVKRSETLAEQLILAVKEGRLEEIPTLVSTAKRIEKFSNGNFVVKDGRVEINGVAAPEVLSNKIIRFANEGLPFKPLLKFAENLQANPSFRAVNELFQFLEKNDHPLTEDGNFLAFRRIRSDYKDIYTGTIDNSPGKEIEMPRNQVDEDCNRTCSKGYHASSWRYAHTQYASSNPDTDIMIEVEINPADVVAVPIDYDNAKLRICKYKVLGVVTTPFNPDECLRRTLNVDNNATSGSCCEEGHCSCPLDCNCTEYCETDDCKNCENNKANYRSDIDEDVCEFCGEEQCYGECEEDEYPYEDEMKF